MDPGMTRLIEAKEKRDSLRPTDLKRLLAMRLLMGVEGTGRRKALVAFRAFVVANSWNEWSRSDSPCERSPNRGPEVKRAYRDGRSSRAPSWFRTARTSSHSSGICI